jgi:hypothetical protein
VITVISGLIFITSQAVLALINTHTLTDEMFFIVPLSPRQYLNAYWGTLALHSLFSFSLLFPPLIILLIILRGYYYVIFMPVIVLLFSHVFGLMMFSFTAQARSAGNAKPTNFEGFVFAIINFTFVCVLPIPWLGTALFVFNIFKLNGMNIFENFGFISIYILLPIALLANGITAYKICRNGFKTSYRTNWFAMFRIIFIYTIVNIVCALLYTAFTAIYYYFT